MADDLVVKLTAQYSELKAGMEQSSAAVQSATGKINSSLDSMGARSREAFAKVREGALSLPAPIEKANEAIHGLELTLDELGKLAVVGFLIEVANKFKELIVGSVESAEALEHMSARTGIAVSELAAMGKVLALAGVGNESFERSMRMLSSQLDKAESGSVSATKAFHDIGINFKDLEGLSPEAVFYRVADAVRKLPEGFSKAGEVAALLGARMGTQLIPILDLGSGKIKQLVGDQKILGSETDAQGGSLVELGHTWSAFASILEGAGRSSVVSMAKPLEDIILVLEGMIIIVEEVGATIKDIFKGIVYDVVAAYEIIRHPWDWKAIINETQLKEEAVNLSGDLKKIYAQFAAAKDVANTDLSVKTPDQGGGSKPSPSAAAASQAAKDAFAQATELYRLDEAEHEKNTELKIADEQKLYLEATRLFGATSIEARKQYVEVTKAKDEQANEIQRIALNSAQNEASIAEATTRAQIAEAQRTAKAKEDLLHKQGSAKGADPKAFAQAEIEAAQIETQAQMDATNAEYQDKLKGYDNELGILRLNETANKESIEKIIAEKRKAEIEWNAEKQKITQDGLLKEQQIQEDAAKKVQQTWEQATVKIEDSFEGLFDKMLTATNKGTDKISIIWKKFTQDLSRDALEAGIFGGGGGTIGASIFGQKGQGGGLIGAGQTLLGLGGQQQGQGQPSGGGGGGGGGGIAGTIANALKTALAPIFAPLKQVLSQLISKVPGLAGAAGGAAQGGAQAAGKASDTAQLTTINTTLGTIETTLTANSARESAQLIAMQGVLTTLTGTASGIIAAVQAAATTASIAAIGENSELTTADTLLASIAAESAYAGGGIVPSAAGGMIVGRSLSGGGQRAVLHPREMVLPAHLSEGVQKAIENGGLGSGDMHFHVHAIDTKDFKDHLSDHGNHIADIMSRQVRLGKYAGRR